MAREPHIWTPEHDRLEPLYGSPATLLPLMVEPQPDTADRVRRQVQAIPWALPEKKREIAFTESEVRNMHYEGEPTVFRFDEREEPDGVDPVR
jgi:hypothetical protein